MLKKKLEQNIKDLQEMMVQQESVNNTFLVSFAKGNQRKLYLAYADE